MARRLCAVTRGQPARNEGSLLLPLLHLGTHGVLDEAGQRLALLQHGLGRFAARGPHGAMEEMRTSWQAQCVAIAMQHRKRPAVLQGFLCQT